MSRKHFSGLLAAVVVVVIAIALLVPRQTVRQETPHAGLLLPDLATAVNEVNRLEIISAGNQPVATLEKGDQAWTVNELSGYPADWNTVRGVLAGLSEARVVEPKTDNPDFYPRLGVEDVSGEDAQQRGLARAVGADEAVALAGIQLERHVREERALSERLGEPGSGQHRCAG